MKPRAAALVLVAVILLLALGILLAPRAADAQEPTRMPRIGVLLPGAART